MNLIQTAYQQSKYAAAPHLTIRVDGDPLDVILHEKYPDRNLIGLVPTLLNWLKDPEERKLVWERIDSNCKQIVPILMCPEDIDLWCTVVVVKMEKTDSTVKWLRAGLDVGDGTNMPYSIGTAIDWFDGFESFEFDRCEFDTVLEAFRKELENEDIK